MPGFFLIAGLAIMSLVRQRFPQLKYTVLFDIILCIAIANMWPHAIYTLALPLFSAMYLGVYLAAAVGAYLFFEFDAMLAAIIIFSTLNGILLRLWASEYTQKLRLRDESSAKYYEMESQQEDTLAALMDVEKATGISERTRIARDIHDNAGHEIVAAYISFQAIRKLLGASPTSAEILQMFDDALGRLNNGTVKIRETAHNLQSATLTGVDGIREACRKFPICPVDFRVYGDTTRVPMYVWHVLGSCLNECLTNVARHSRATKVLVTLDAALHIVRLRVENDGAIASSGTGTGLRNLRQRVTAIGGSLSVDAHLKNDMFRVICVVPIEEVRSENINR